jgi:hypothetical protein
MPISPCVLRCRFRRGTDCRRRDPDLVHRYDVADDRPAVSRGDRAARLRNLSGLIEGAAESSSGGGPGRGRRTALLFMRSCGECAFHTTRALRSQLQNAPDGIKIIPASQPVQVIAKADAENLQPPAKLHWRATDLARSASSTRRQISNRISSLRRLSPREILLRKLIRFPLARILGRRLERRSSTST